MFRFACVLSMIGFLGCQSTPVPNESPVTAESATQGAVQPSDDACTVAFNVQGMVCDVGCPPMVKKALLTVDGVQSVEVEYEKSLATVHGAGEACTANGTKAMLDALKAKDYTGTPVPDPTANAAEPTNG